MSGTNQFLTLAGVALVGILIGNAIGSSRSEESAVGAQLEALRGEVAELAGTIAVLRENGDALAGSIEAGNAATVSMGEDLEGRLARIETGVADGLEALDDRVTALAEGSSDIAGRVDGVSGRLDSLETGMADRLGSLETGMAERLAALTAPSADDPAAAEPAAEASAADEADRVAAVEPEAEAEAAAEPEGPSPEEQAAALAEAAGPDALVLRVGQTGAVGDQRVFLSRVADGTAYMRHVGVGDISTGRWTNPADLGNGCTLSFVGAADGKTYLRPECEGTEVAVRTVATDAAPEPEAGDAADLPDTGPDGVALGIGMTGTIGDQAVFVRRIEGDAVHLRLVGGEDASVGRYDAPLDLGNGCTLGFAGQVGRMAYLSGECGAAAVAASETAPAETGTAETLRLAIGETGRVAGTGVFLSRRSDDAAHLVVIGGDGDTVTASRDGGPAELDNGCTLGFGGIEDGRVVLEPDC